jgi:SAM-dependent methyltransferase
MLRCARHNAETLRLEVDFQKGDAERVPFADESFDAVVNRFVLWTLFEPEKAISEWFRVLKPSGKIVFIDGTWYVGKSLKKRAWRILSAPLIMATEGRNLLLNDFDLHIKNNLPLAQAKRPEKGIELLRQCGFKDVSTKPILFESSLFSYIKRGYWGDSFLVQGVK